VFVVVTEEEHWMLREREEEEKDITEDLAWRLQFLAGYV
jgi:hypothetical protein